MANICQIGIIKFVLLNTTDVTTSPLGWWGNCVVDILPKTITAVSNKPYVYCKYSLHWKNKITLYL